MSKVYNCLTCCETMGRNWNGAKYCSDACKQKAYRQRLATVTKKVNRGCVRCGKSAGKSMYCSGVCKAMTNREKQGATARKIQAMSGDNFGTVWMKCNENWKLAYAYLQDSGYIYKPHLKAWWSVVENPPLPQIDIDRW